MRCAGAVQPLYNYSYIYIYIRLAVLQMVAWIRNVRPVSIQPLCKLVVHLYAIKSQHHLQR